MKKILKAAATLGMILILASGGLAQFNPQRSGQKMNRGRRGMVPSASPLLGILQAKKEELKVTDDQLAKIKDLMFAFEEKSIKAKNVSALKKLELRKLMQDKESRDYEAIRQNLGESAAVHQNMFIDRLKLKDDIHGLLSPEQQAALKALQKQRPMRGQRGRSVRGQGRMGRRGPGLVNGRSFRQGKGPRQPGFKSGPPPIKK